MKRSFIFLLSGAILSLLLSSCGPVTEETSPVRKDVTETVFAAGALEAEGMYQLTAQTSGYITHLNFEEGTIIEKGDVLAVIQNTENIINTKGATELLDIAKSNSADTAPLLLQAEYNIQIQKQKMEQDKKTEERYKRLLKSQSIARVEYENALLAYETSKSNYQSALENYKQLKRDANQQVVNKQTNTDIYSTQMGKNQVQAVVRGKVYKQFKEVGDYVRQGDVIAEIGSPEVLFAKVNIDESNISNVKIGQDAVIQLNTNEDKQYQGFVKEIKPSFDEATQSFICKIYFTDSLDFHIVHTQLQTNIIVGEQNNALLIPRNYLDYGGYVQVKGETTKTKITTQFVSNEWVQVLSGIDEHATWLRTMLSPNNQCDMILPVNIDIAQTHILKGFRQTMVASLGVALGVAIYLFMNSLDSGFSDFSRDNIFQSSAHVKIYRDDVLSQSLLPVEAHKVNAIVNPQITTLTKTLINPEMILEQVKEEPYITNAIAQIDYTLFYNRGKTQVKGTGIGVNMIEYNEMFSTQKHMVAGNVADLQSNPNGVIIGSGVAEKLSLNLGDNLSISSSYESTRSCA